MQPHVYRYYILFTFYASMEKHFVNVNNSRWYLPCLLCVLWSRSVRAYLRDLIRQDSDQELEV